MSQNSAHFQIRGKPGFIDSCVGLVPTNVLVSRDLANFLVGYAEVTSAVQNVNERSLPVSQVLRIANLGGVIGFGEVSDGENGYADPDPVAAWITKYANAWDLMGGKGVALGTDTNGLSPLIPGDIV